MSHDYGLAEEDIPRPSSEDPGSPVFLLVAAGGAVLVGLGIMPLGLLAAHVIGYLLASLVAFTLVALYRRFATARFVAVGIGASPSALRVSIAVLLVGLAVAVVHAYWIARHFA